MGLTAEGGSSQTFVARMGAARAKEALIFGKKMTAQELLSCGFLKSVVALAGLTVQQSLPEVR